MPQSLLFLNSYSWNTQDRSRAQGWEVGKYVAHNQKQTRVHLKGTYIPSSCEQSAGFQMMEGPGWTFICFVLNSCLANKYSNIATYQSILTNPPFSGALCQEWDECETWCSPCFLILCFSFHPSRVIFPHSSYFPGWILTDLKDPIKKAFCGAAWR